MSRNQKCVITAQKPGSQFVSDPVCLFRRYLTGLERLPELIGKGLYIRVMENPR